MAELVDLECWRGTHREFVFVVYDQAGEPRDVTGWSFAFNVAADLSNDSPLISVTSDTSAITILSGPDGQVKVTLTPTETSVAAGLYYHTLARTDEGEEDVAAEGRFTIKANAVFPL